MTDLLYLNLAVAIPKCSVFVEISIVCLIGDEIFIVFVPRGWQSSGHKTKENNVFSLESKNFEDYSTTVSKK